jgi:hypothetical protein
MISFKRLVRQVFLALPLLFVGCTQILNTHSTGTGPAGAGSLPGAPGGDSVSSVGNVVYNSGNIQLAADGASPAASVELVPGGKPHDTNSYSLNFSGVKLTITANPVLAIDVVDDEGAVACGLEIAGGEFRLIGGDGPVVIDTYTGAADEHRIFMRLDKNVDRCFIRIEQVTQGTDGPPIKPVVTGDAPFVDSAFDELDFVRVRWEQTSESDATNYFLGPVVITQAG